jgi:hypothetical protein
MGAPAAGFQANWTELKETDGKIKGGVNPWCYGRLIECLDGQREQGEGGRAPPCRGRKEGEEERKGKTEADRWDPPVGAAEKKRGRGVSSGPAGKTGLGRLGRKGGWVVLFFFLFQTSFSNPFLTQIQIKLLQTFLKYFIGFLETTQAIKNHASQLMMHIHLLFLTLLYYL